MRRLACPERSEGPTPVARRGLPRRPRPRAAVPNFQPEVAPEYHELRCKVEAYASDARPRRRHATGARKANPAEKSASARQAADIRGRNRPCHNSRRVRNHRIALRRISPHRSGAYLWCAYHVHSTFSDGLQSPEEIAQQARAAGVTLVLLTDHGRPNVASSIFRQTIAGVTIVGGSEATLPDGHFTFFGARQAPGFRVSSFPPEAMQDARGLGRFSRARLPGRSPLSLALLVRRLAARRHRNIEFVYRLAPHVAGRALATRDLLSFFSRYYFVKTVSFSPESMLHWDNFLQHDRTWGFVASDAHGGFHITKFLTIRVPWYGIHLLVRGHGHRPPLQPHSRSSDPQRRFLQLHSRRR